MKGGECARGYKLCHFGVETSIRPCAGGGAIPLYLLDECDGYRVPRRDNHTRDMRSHRHERPIKGPVMPFSSRETRGTDVLTDSLYRQGPIFYLRMEFPVGTESPDLTCVRGRSLAD